MAIIDDCPVFQRGLAQLLANAVGLELGGVARSIEEFNDLGCNDVGVVVLGLDLPRPGGAAIVGRACRPHYALLVVSSCEEKADVIAAIRAGASGYVSRRVEEAELLRALRAVAGGRTYLSTTLVDNGHSTSMEITEREAQILSLLAAGETDQEIARSLHISVCTVRSHLDRIRDKTGSRRRAQLTRLALERTRGPSRSYGW